MRLVDADKLFPDVMKVDGSMAISQGQLAHAHTVEAIPKAEYENRLKADMVAMLTEIQLEIEEYDVIGNHSTGSYDADLYNGAYSDGMARASSIIQQKIDALKAESEDKDENKFKIKL